MMTSRPVGVRANYAPLDVVTLVTLLIDSVNKWNQQLSSILLIIDFWHSIEKVLGSPLEKGGVSPKKLFALAKQGLKQLSLKMSHEILNNCKINLSEQKKMVFNTIFVKYNVFIEMFLSFLYIWNSGKYCEQHNNWE